MLANVSSAKQILSTEYILDNIFCIAQYLQIWTKKGPFFVGNLKLKDFSNGVMSGRQSSEYNASSPNFQLRLGVSDCAPELAFASRVLGHLLGSAAHSSPTILAKTGRSAQVFATQECGMRTLEPYSSLPGAP